jgi:hypothetical protein
MQGKVKPMKQLKYIIIFGDIIYTLWILYNGIDEGFADIFTVRGIVPLGLAFLLILNIFILSKRK